MGAGNVVVQSITPIGIFLEARRSRAKKKGMAGNVGEVFVETATQCDFPEESRT
jgi:hypothetical protein